MAKSCNPILHVAVGIILDAEHKILVSQRQKALHLGEWEFPGGKIEQDETPYQALCRELDEELGIEVKSASPLIEVAHDYDLFSVVLHVWQITSCDGFPKGKEGQALRWVKLEDLQSLKLPASNFKILPSLASVL